MPAKKSSMIRRTHAHMFEWLFGSQSFTHAEIKNREKLKIRAHTDKNQHGTSCFRTLSYG